MCRPMVCSELDYTDEGLKRLYDEVSPRPAEGWWTMLGKSGSCQAFMLGETVGSRCSHPKKKTMIISITPKEMLALTLLSDLTSKVIEDER